MYLAKRGYSVYGSSREPDKVLKRADEFYEYIALNVESDASVDAALTYIMEREGKIDAVVYCAGFWLAGSVEDTTFEEISRIFEVNVFGAIRICKKFIKIIRESGGGKIIVTTSVTGRVPVPFQAAFGASKAAIESFLRAFRMEVQDQGVHVIVMEPGDFLSSKPIAKQTTQGALLEQSVYLDYFEKAVTVLSHDTAGGAFPLTFAKMVLQALQEEKPKFRYRIGTGFAFDLEPLFKFLPSKLTDFIIKRYYGLY